VKPGARLDDAGLLDVAPTLLTLLGLPAADDMPGRVLVEGLAGAAAEPLPRIASYENAAPPTAGGGAPAPAAAATRRDPAADEALLARLRSLGYLGAGETAPHQSPQGERNLAAIEFEAGRYLESAEAYRRLLEQAPDDPGLRTSYAGALGALGRFDEAEAELRRALAADPINVEAHHNLGVLAERRGDREAAVAHYREALRYRPDYAPSRQALMLLTGSAETRPTSTAAEARAAELADRASLAARKGDYPAALELLDRAERQAPDFVLVYQYRANVAYLMGDREAAAAALEKALALEPDNALFRENLRRLRQPPGGR
jgi:tetratricopeptide (TPR) repeat protein